MSTERDAGHLNTTHDDPSRAPEVNEETPPPGVPVYEADLFTDEAILDPHTHYQRLRDLGPVVWLQAHGVLALSRYDEVRAALADDRGLCSSKGVGFHNPEAEGNPDEEPNIPSTIFSDGDWHDQVRSVSGRGVTPRALRGLRPDLAVSRLARS